MINTLSVLEKISAYVKCICDKLNEILPSPQTVTDCDGNESEEDALPAVLKGTSSVKECNSEAILAELVAFRSEMAGSQSAIELAINTQGAAIVSEVALASTDIQGAITTQTSAIQTTLIDQTDAIVTAIEDKSDEEQDLLADILVELGEIKVFVESIDTTQASALTELQEANTTLESLLTEVSEQGGTLDHIDEDLHELLTAVQDICDKLDDILTALAGLQVSLDTLNTNTLAGNVILGDILTELGDILSEIQANGATLTDLLTESLDQGATLDAILAALNAGLTVNVDLTPITDAIAALQLSLEGLLNTANAHLFSIDANTDSTNTKLDTLISETQAGNITLTAISAGVAALLPELQAINANTDQVETLLGDILSAINAIPDLDDTDDDFRPIAPKCYFNTTTQSEEFGYFKVDEAGDNPVFVSVTGYEPKPEKNILAEKICYEIKDDQGAVIEEVRVEKIRLIRGVETIETSEKVESVTDTDADASTLFTLGSDFNPALVVAPNTIEEACCCKPEGDGQADDNDGGSSEPATDLLNGIGEFDSVDSPAHFQEGQTVSPGITAIGSSNSWHENSNTPPNDPLTSVPSPQGGKWLAGAAWGSPREGFDITLTGLTVGETYTVGFWQTVMDWGRADWNPTLGDAANLNITLDGQTVTSNMPFNGDGSGNVTWVWTEATFTNVSSSSTSLKFVADQTQLTSDAFFFIAIDGVIVNEGDSAPNPLGEGSAQEVIV